MREEPVIRELGHLLEGPGLFEQVRGSGHEHYRVQWEDGHESIFTPGSDAVIRHVERPQDDDPVLVHEP